MRSPKALATACGATAYLLAYRGAPSAFDEWLALPIAVETAFPGTYPKGDLLIQGSMDGPFHFYKLASALYSMGVNVDVAWYALLALSLVAFFLAVWRLAGAMELDDRERMILVLAIAASPIYRGTLHWSAQPMLSFITASVAVPVGLLAVTAALEERVRPALLYCALAFDIHPSLGLCAGITVVSIVPGSFSLKALRTAWLPAALVALPNVVYLLGHLPAPAAPGGDQLWDVHRVFGYHTFFRDHAAEYPWYALALAIALAYATQGGRARRAGHAAVVLTATAAVWILVMNLWPIPALLPLYLIRASLLAKPLVMGLAVLALTRRSYAGRYAWLAPIGGVLAVASPNSVVAEAALAIVLGIVLRSSADRRLATVGLAAWTVGILLMLVVLARQVPSLDALTDATTSLRWVAMTAGLAASAMLLFSPPVASEPRRVPRGWVALLPALSLPVLSIILSKPPGTAWLPDRAARISTRLHLSLPAAKETGVMQWALSASLPGSLFAIPPVNSNWVRFRLVTRRGAYVTVHDINQLMYVRKYVPEAVARLTTLRVIVRGPHRFDPRPYSYPTCERLARLAADRVDYYVLPAESVVPVGGVLAYRDEYYSVMDVQRTVPSCRPEAN
ncbi:MAG: hypothetical protein ACYC3F_06950 [Gemmatimonadaceae bacterium]